MRCREATPDDDVHALSEFAARTWPMACPECLQIPRSAIEAFIADHLSPAHFDAFIRRDRDRCSVMIATDEADGNRILAYTLALLPPPGSCGPPRGVDAEEIAPFAEIFSRERVAYLSKIYCESARHGTGVASALLEAHCTLLAGPRFSCVALALGTNAHNERAVRFYRKHGFAEVGARTFRVGSIVCNDLAFLRRFN